MQFLILLCVSFAVILFFMLTLRGKKGKSSCGCGQGHCGGESCGKDDGA